MEFPDGSAAVVAIKGVCWTVPSSASNVSPSVHLIALPHPLPQLRQRFGSVTGRPVPPSTPPPQNDSAQSVMAIPVDTMYDGTLAASGMRRP